MSTQNDPGPADVKSNDQAQVSGLERTNRALRKTRNTMYAVWAYVFYGCILVLGVAMLLSGSTIGLVFIAAAIVLFALYWLFGYVVCCR